MTKRVISLRVDDELLAAFTASAEARSMTRTAAIEKLMRRQVEVDARTREYPIDYGAAVERPDPTRVLDEREAGKTQPPCRHPVNMRIGDGCGLCGATMSKR